MAVVLKQPATINAPALTSVSFKSRPHTFDGLTIKLLSEFGRSLPLRQPNNAGEDRNDGDDCAADGEEFDHFTAFFAA